jgi:hypothetical protein
VKDCRVYFRDTARIEHGVYLRAANRYHAFGLSDGQMRKCSWCNPDFREVQRMNVQLIEQGKNWRQVSVMREQFEAWLASTTAKDGADRQRHYLNMLLDREEPDRDFKRGLRER